MKNQQKQFVFQTKVLDEQNRIIEMVGSTEDYDRAGDKMFMSGVDYKDFLNNPIILPNHDYRSQAIGKALNIETVGSKLVFKIQFAETELGKEWFYLYANKYMNASSIGFIPIEYKPNDKGGYDFTKWQLLELSLVTVPCNPNAIQRAFEGGHISKALFDLIKNESGEDKMKKSEIEALISKAVDDKVKELNGQHQEEVKKLNDTIKTLEGQVAGKSGAKLSKASLETLTKACDGITEHVKNLKALAETVADPEDPNNENGEDEEKEYTEEEIQKMVASNVEKLVKEAK